MFFLTDLVSLRNFRCVRLRLACAGRRLLPACRRTTKHTRDQKKIERLHTSTIAVLTFSPCPARTPTVLSDRQTPRRAHAPAKPQNTSAATPSAERAQTPVRTRPSGTSPLPAT